MSNFKEFVKNENSERRRAKIAGIFEFLQENAGSIVWTMFILCFIFALLYVIFADSNKKYDTKITNISRIEKQYVNDADTTYQMVVESKELGKLNVNLTKEEYVTYSTSYNKGVTNYLYTDYDGFYFVCLIFVIITAIIFFITAD